jgi:hypothetical protein
LKPTIGHGKKVITDQLDGSKANPDKYDKLALPNPTDKKVLAYFKLQAWCYHKSVSGHLKFFPSLDKLICHNLDSHMQTFEGVCVIFPYQMDNGQRTKDNGQRTKDKGQRTRDIGQRTKDKGQWTMDNGQ